MNSAEGRQQQRGLVDSKPLIPKSTGTQNSNNFHFSVCIMVNTSTKLFSCNCTRKTIPWEFICNQKPLGILISAIATINSLTSMQTHHVVSLVMRFPCGRTFSCFFFVPRIANLIQDCLVQTPFRAASPKWEKMAEKGLLA